MVWYYRLHNYEQLACDVNKFHFISNTNANHNWAARCMQQSHIKYLVTWKQPKRDQLSNILWNLYIKFVSSYQIPCDDGTCMHAVFFTSYVVKNCINAHISFALPWLNVTSWEMVKGWKWNLMVEIFIQIWIPLSILAAVSPKKQKNYFTLRPTWSNYSRIVTLCIHILACSYQWNKYSYLLTVNVFCVLIPCTHNIYFCIKYKSESM